MPKAEYYRYQCNTLTNEHRYGSSSSDLAGKTCLKCPGELKAIQNPATQLYGFRGHSPKYPNFEKQAAKLAEEAARVERKAKTSTRQLALAARKSPEQKQQDAEMKSADEDVKAHLAQEALAAPESKRALMQDALMDGSEDPEDPDYTGPPVFTAHMRLFVDNVSDPFASIATSSSSQVLKRTGIFSTNVDEKGGRKSPKKIMGRTASFAMFAAGHADVPAFKKGNKDRQHGEWCHLQADSLGGQSVAGNFVAARFAANSFMMVIEQAVSRKPFFARVEAHGSPGFDDTPQVIQYHLWRSDPTIGTARTAVGDIVFLIDPKLKSFTRSNWEDVHRQLRAQNFNDINPIIPS